MQIRKAAVAGHFYTAIAEELKSEVISYLKNAKKVSTNKVLAVVSPHAGYIFSGKIAAKAIVQIDNSQKYDNIFVIGLSHRKRLKGAAIYNLGDFQMPGFTAKVNIDLANDLIKSCEFIESDATAHQYEHSIEVQLPFIHYFFDGQYQIVPILIGTNDTNVLKSLASSLKPYFNHKNIFVVSTDFSHYPNYQNAKYIDRCTAEAFVSNDVDKFLQTLYDNETKHIEGLATSACNWAGLACLLYMTQGRDDLNFRIIDYQNSGDVSFGDKDSVVGYYAIVVEQK